MRYFVAESRVRVQIRPGRTEYASLREMPIRVRVTAGGHLEVEEIRVVPDDYPEKAEAEYVAYKVALAVRRGDI